MQTTQQRLEVRRNRPDDYRFSASLLRPTDAGEILLVNERFGLSANNVTYAALGDVLHYANFFACAAPDADWSMLPVWSVARVLESRSEWLQVGDRVYGFFPCASHALLKPHATTADGFRVERAGIPDHFNFYHRYSIADRDPLFVPEQLDAMVVLRPLFMTSLLLADYLNDPKFSEVEQFVLSSASSKTALGTASALATASSKAILGLASVGNQQLALNFGGYGEVLSYAEIEKLPARETLYVDFSGDAALRERLATHLGPQLKRVISVGMTHWQAGAAGKPKGDYASEVFFAPGWAAARKQADPNFAKRMFDGWQRLLAQATTHFPVQHQQGREAIETCFADLVNGKAGSDVVRSFAF